MLISRLALIAALSLSAAAFPAGRLDARNHGVSMPQGSIDNGNYGGEQPAQHGPPSKPNRTGPSSGDRSGLLPGPDRSRPDHFKPDHHDKPSKDRPSGRPSKPDGATPTSKPADGASPTPSKPVGSENPSAPTPTASSKPQTSAGPAY